MKEPTVAIMARLPQSVHGWLKAQAERNATSINSEIIRAVRDAMDRQTGQIHSKSEMKINAPGEGE